MLVEQCKEIHLPKNIPKNFQTIRPWVHHGWEMVLLAAECTSSTSYLNSIGVKAFCQNYSESCNRALEAWKWHPKNLQNALDNARDNSITNDLKHWLNCHKAFPGVINSIKQLEKEGIEFSVLTTKSVTFTRTILKSFNLEPSLVFGHQSGSKPEVLKELIKQREIKAFIEDRRTTLETVLQDPELSLIPCYLASWGYLKPDDLKHLPHQIHLLTLNTLNEPISNWS